MSYQMRARANSEHYLKLIKDVCELDCHAHYGIPPECWFRPDGESSHTPNVVQKYCSARPPELSERGFLAGPIA